MPLHKARKSPLPVAPSTDPLFSNVGLLLPLREDFNDRSPYARSPSNTSVVLTSNQAKFGSQSAKFENFGHLDYQGLDLNFPADFTFECWIYQMSRPTGISSIFETYNGNDGYSFAISNGNLVCFDGSTGFVGLSVIPLMQWVHLAAIRKNSILTLCLDGFPDLVARSTKPLTIPGNIRVGTNLSSNPPIFQQDAYFQDLRLTRAARSPILPTQPLPTS